MNDFFSLIKVAEGPLVIKNEEYRAFKKYGKGCYYNCIASFRQNEKVVGIVLYKQNKNAKRSLTSTNAFEFNYMLEGKMQYTLERRKYILEEGDSFYYDAGKPHLSTDNHFTMLVIYFFKN